MSIRPNVPPELSALAAKIGANPLLVQGAGGNASAKVGDVLWIKASGKWMSAAHTEPIFAAVRLSGVRKRLAKREADPTRPELLPMSPTGLRPSIETSMHALLPHRFVMHVHSVNAIAFSVCADGRDQLKQRLAGLHWIWVPYARPGVDLTNAIDEALQDMPADVLILANHGLIVGGSHASAVEALIDDVEKRLHLPARSPMPADFATLESLSKNTPYHPAPKIEWHAMATDAAQRTIALGGSLYPDHVVFLGPAVTSLGSHQSVASLVQAHIAAELELPALLIVPDAGVLLRGDLTAGALAMVDCLAMVLARIPEASQVHYLARGEVAGLLEWEAEKYRQSLSLAQQTTMRNCT